MLRVFCFDGLGVSIEDLYFVNPKPAPGQEGDERGIRIEVRLLDPQPWRGSIYASQRLVVDQAVWRADFLESIERGPGSKDRMHHHPVMKDNEPGPRVFDRRLTGDPMGWLTEQLTDVVPILKEAAVPDPASHRAAADALRAALPEVVGTAEAVLAEVRAGRLTTSPPPAPAG